MSLNYDLSKVANLDSLDPNVTEAMIYNTMLVGIGNLNESMAPMFYARVRAYERLTGNTLKTTDGAEYPITPEIVQAYIGMKTNVSFETSTQFKTKMFRWMIDYADREWRAKVPSEK